MKYVILSCLLINTAIVHASAAGAAGKESAETAKPTLFKKHELAQRMVSITKAQAEALDKRTGIKVWPAGEQKPSCMVSLNKVIGNVAVEPLNDKPQSTNKDFAPDPEVNFLELTRLKYNRYLSKKIAVGSPVIAQQPDKSFVFGLVIGNTTLKTTRQLIDPATKTLEKFEVEEDAYVVQTALFEQITVPALGVAIQETE
jgi:hypothetical protein